MMAEVEQANTQSSISPQTAPGLEPVLQPYSNTVPPTDNSVCLVDIPASDTAQQVPARVLPEKSVPESSDDEVEFVFSVPRRRKKKHRRLELPSKYTQINLASPISSAGVIGACPSSEKLIADMAPLLDPCSEPDEMNRARCYSVNATDKTAIFDTSIQPLKVPQSELPESSHSHISQNIPFKIPPSCPVYGHTGFVDFLEDPNVPTTFGGVPLPLPPHRPIIPGWQDFSWKQPGYSTPKRTPSVDPRARVFSNINNDSDWHRKYYFGVVDPNCRNTQQVTFGNSPTERCAQEMVSPKTIPLITQTKPVSYPSIQTKLVPESCHMPTKMSTSAITTCPVQPSLIISSNSAAYSQPTHPVTPVRHTCPSSFPRSQVAAADIRRKPSLYRIPAWPHLLDNNKASSSGALDERQNPTCVAESNDIFFPHSNTTQEARPTTSHTQNSISSLLQTPVSHPSRSQASISISASAPAARHSPNLIIDIAQTSQDTFPFAAVAARHNKPIQKVFDTFSAIIQLPLLKQAADGRRHGPLGSERMRMYREAKRAMEKANRESEKGRIESKQGK
ncbi:hypothetical protein BCIN_06g03490 [Botrytis cinerea B05.10]|uniref:Uncharacterized protein n=1 Tax=Botryotinia fuckeliana (strain B05.10) TaxID=332648 RepID=A0A384JJW4_BOTFB|nr:hypothetical protein BCIN_06g03490 [Botrytis cinerea B05.10]ATZ50876.1 hypothetical protein BCIN_06g03490 [Botrytis cinerea B05.10]